MATPKRAPADNKTAQKSTDSVAGKDAQVNDPPKSKTAATTEAQAIEPYQANPLPANRPLVSRSLELVNHGSLPGNRPIAVAHLEIVNADSLPNQRPIIHSGLEIVNRDAIAHDRPIIRRGLPFTPSPDLPNNRPIATNEIYDSEELMGYID